MLQHFKPAVNLLLRAGVNAGQTRLIHRDGVSEITPGRGKVDGQLFVFPVFGCKVDGVALGAACGFGVIAHDAELFRNGRGFDGLFVSAAARESQGADNGGGNARSRNETREHKKMNSWVYGFLAADL